MTRVRKTQSPKTYPLNQSPFYKLSTKKKLADFLGLELRNLFDITKEVDNSYKTFVLGSGHLVKHPLFYRKPREVQQLKPRLERVHKRIYELLKRIETPNYLHSATKGKSYATNASAHAKETSEMSYNVDIKQFYQNVRQVAIFDFFARTMLCSRDVAFILSSLCSYKGIIPTGSCLSPLLSFFVNQKMFDALHDLAINNSLVMTVYVDDVVFSGVLISENVAYKIDSTVKSFRYHPHKQKLFKRNQVKIITGLAINRGVISVPQRRLAKLRILINTLRNSINKDERVKLGNALLGMANEIGQFSPRAALFAAKNGVRLCPLLHSQFTNLVMKFSKRLSSLSTINVQSVK